MSLYSGIDASSLLLAADSPSAEMPDILPLADGGVIVDLGAESLMQPPKPETNFNSNLALFVSNAEMDALGADLCDAVEQDIKSYEEWTQIYLKGIKLLGFKPEEKTFPFVGACGVYDTLLSEAVIRFQAEARGEMLPAEGPVKVKITGYPSEDKEKQGERVKAFMNLYLTELAPEYYEDTDMMLMWLPIVGSTFKKVYQDPVLNRAKSDFIPPDQFIVNYNTKSLDNCGRMTHLIPMNGKQLRERQLLKFYREVELTDPSSTDETDARREINFEIGLDAETSRLETSAVFKVDETYSLYEIHADIDLPGFEHTDDAGRKTGLPLPYIVTVEKETQKILSIYRNWKEGDRRYKKKEYFVHFKFIPGLGFYGYGYSHILGSNAQARTSIARQLVDSGTFANFPGGVRAKGARFAENNISIAPGEFPEVETGGLPIDQVFKPLPYKEPSPGLYNIYKDIGEQTRSLANTTDIAVGDGRQDAPVGTTMALLEAATKVSSAVIKRLHVSFKKEFKLFKQLFAEYLSDRPYPFSVEGAEMAVMRADFNDSVNFIPVSDPNITSSAQRMARQEAVLRITQTVTPNIPPYQREAIKMLYTQMGVDKPDRFLPPLPQQAQPMDPVSENQAALRGMPIVAAEYQDHDAHIASHTPFIQDPNMAAHVQEHAAMKYRIMIEQQLGRSLPPQGQPLPPELENQIAIMAAKATQEIKAKQEAMTPGQPQTPVVDLGFAALQDTIAKTKIAQMKAKTDEDRIQADLTKARIKADTDAMNAAVKAQQTKVNAIVKLKTDDSSHGDSLPPEVRE